MALPISHYMVRTLFVLSSEDSASSARALMAQHELHYLPVVDENQLVGVVSDSALAKLTGEHDRVADALTADVTEVVPTIPLTEILALMQEHQLSSVVVTGESGIEGVFTLTDAMRDFGEMLEQATER